MNYCNGDIAEFEGRRFKVTIEQDSDMGEPWKEHDGHGVVSDWERRDKRPGERVLCSERGSKRFYDVQETMKIAYRDGWGLGNEDREKLLKRLSEPRLPRRRYSQNTKEIPGRDPNKPLTKGEITAEAVRRDFEYCRGYLNDQWTWQWVRVELVDDDDEVIDGYEDSVGGVEGSDDKYVGEIVEECMRNVISNLESDQKKAADSEIESTLDMAIEDCEAAYWRERGVMTSPSEPTAFPWWVV